MTSATRHHTVTRYFTVVDADRLIAFTISVLAAELFREARHRDGKIQHARVRIGDSVLMMNEATEAFAPNVSQMHVYVDDLDERYALALAEGATSIMTPNLRPHGDRMAGVVEPCGNIWWLAEVVD
ncbi:MAG: VOC family protein [Pseudomonadota bacterium]